VNIQWQHEGEAPPINHCALVGLPKGEAAGRDEPLPFWGSWVLAGMEGGKGFFPVAKYTKSCSFDNMTQNLRRGSSHSAAVAQKPLMKIQSPV